MEPNEFWWPGWDSNPQNSDFESDTYANSITRPNKQGLENFNTRFTASAPNKSVFVLMYKLIGYEAAWFLIPIKQNFF